MLRPRWLSEVRSDRFLVRSGSGLQPTPSVECRRAGVVGVGVGEEPPGASSRSRVGPPVKEFGLERAEGAFGEGVVSASPRLLSHQIFVTVSAHQRTRGFAQARQF